jgi:signal peptidase I
MNETNIQEGTFLFRTSGQSMWPFVRDGDRLIVRSVLASQLKSGDVVVYKTQDSVVCHRIVARSGSGQELYFLVRGDCSQGAPERVAASAIIGRVCGIARGDKTVQWQGSGFDITNKIILVVAPAIAFVFDFFNHFRRKK